MPGVNRELSGYFKDQANEVLAEGVRRILREEALARKMKVADLMRRGPRGRRRPEWENKLTAARHQVYWRSVMEVGANVVIIAKVCGQPHRTVMGGLIQTRMEKEK